MNAFVIDGKLITDKNDIRDMWANHFEDLGKPSVSPSFDHEFSDRVATRVRTMFASCQNELPGTLTLSDVGFFEPSVMAGGGAWRNSHHNCVVIAPMIMKFGTDIKLDVFYTMVTKKFVTSLLLRNCDVITCILADT